jgi:hypothetical protein
MPISIEDLIKLEEVFKKVNYFTINKSLFSHSETRNVMINRNFDADFLIFSTQDTIFPENFAELLHYSVDRMDKQKLAGLCLRHESPCVEMNAVFDNIFKNLPYDSYLESKTDGIYWWSNNFAIYRYSIISENPFPNSVSWAEDLAWAKLISIKGYPLAVTSSFSVQHLNDDSIKSAYRRGLENGIGLIEIHKLLGNDFPHLRFKVDLFRAALGMSRIEFLESNRRKINRISFGRLVKVMLVWSAQAVGRILTLRRFEKKGNAHGNN